MNLAEIDSIFLAVYHKNIIYFPSKKEPGLAESARQPKDLGGKSELMQWRSHYPRMGTEVALPS